MAEPSEQTTSQSISTAPAPVVSLETELTCSICTDLLHNPLTLLDCLHTFCGACLKEWFRFQADRIESLPGPPPPPGTPVYTCPSCREAVRDTRHDARVQTLLDMFLGLYPEKGKSEEEKREMDRRYTRGERVMRRLKFEDRSEEEARRDEEERRLIDEVRAVSLREATERALQGSSSSPSGRRERPRDTRAENAAAAATGEQQRRQIEHQASLRSLISLEGGEMTPSDIEREIEEFARQIQEEGLLDGIDLDNIDLSTNDELSRKITEAYRRRQREKARRQREQRARSTSRAPTMGSERERGRERDPDRDREGERDQDRERERNRERDRSTAPPRSASRNRDPSARPTSRHSMAGHTSSHSRAPSVTSVDDRARYPPSASASASALLEVPDPTTVRRRRASSAGRSATIPPVQLEGRVPERARSETGTRDSSSTRGSDGRSSGSPTTTTAPASSGSRTSSFSSRTGAIPGDRLSVPGPLPSRDPSPETRHRHRQSESASSIPQSHSRHGSTASGSVTPTLTPSPHLQPLSFFFRRQSQTQPLPQPQQRRTSLPLSQREPPTSLPCSTCSRPSIQNELHYYCPKCNPPDGGEWSICLDCWRRGKGCQHWFGFGTAALARWERQKAKTGLEIPPPHRLVGRRWLRISGSGTGNGSGSVRLQIGLFCSRCSAWANSCFWRCETCNDGEWGFCGTCVGRGEVCSHPLTAVSYALGQVQTPTSPTSPKSPVSGGGSVAEIFPTLHIPLQRIASATPCIKCSSPIPLAERHFHCPSCRVFSTTSPITTASSEGSITSITPYGSYSYNLCTPCYHSLISSGTISRENGPSGWRRCPSGHRMVVVGFSQTDSASWERVIMRELVGGRRLRVEPLKLPVSGSSEQETGSRQVVVNGVQLCTWVDPSGTKRHVRRLMTVDVSASSASYNIPRGAIDGLVETAFPPEGGVGMRVVAGWAWIPAAGVQDELMFPRGADITEVEDVNGEWFHGWYMGHQGLFPAPYVRVVGEKS